MHPVSGGGHGGVTAGLGVIDLTGTDDQIPPMLLPVPALNHPFVDWYQTNVNLTNSANLNVNINAGDSGSFVCPYPANNHVIQPPTQIQNIPIIRGSIPQSRHLGLHDTV